MIEFGLPERKRERERGRELERERRREKERQRERERERERKVLNPSAIYSAELYSGTALSQYLA